MLASPGRRRGWAFLFPLLALGWAGSAADGRPSGFELVTVVAVCGLSGIAWQLLHRRDLVDRLTYAAASVVGMAVVFAVFGPDRVSVLPTQLAVGVGAVLAGCVYTEQWWRSRDEARALAHDARSRTSAASPLG